MINKIFQISRGQVGLKYTKQGRSTRGAVLDIVFVNLTVLHHSSVPLIIHVVCKRLRTQRMLVTEKLHPLGVKIFGLDCIDNRHAFIAHKIHKPWSFEPKLHHKRLSHYNQKYT